MVCRHTRGLHAGAWKDERECCRIASYLAQTCIAAVSGWLAERGIGDSGRLAGWGPDVGAISIKHRRAWNDLASPKTVQCVRVLRVLACPGAMDSMWGASVNRGSRT